MSEASKAVLGKQLNYEKDFFNYTENLQFKDIDQVYYDRLKNNLPKVEKTERYKRTYNGKHDKKIYKERICYKIVCQNKVNHS